jgi:hypothetical protein
MFGSKLKGRIEPIIFPLLSEKRFYMFGDEESNSPFKRVQQKEQKAAHAVRR